MVLLLPLSRFSPWFPLVSAFLLRLRPEGWGYVGVGVHVTTVLLLKCYTNVSAPTFTRGGSGLGGNPGVSLGVSTGGSDIGAACLGVNLLAGVCRLGKVNVGTMSDIMRGSVANFRVSNLTDVAKHRTSNFRLKNVTGMTKNGTGNVVLDKLVGITKKGTGNVRVSKLNGVTKGVSEKIAVNNLVGLTNGGTRKIRVTNLTGVTKGSRGNITVNKLVGMSTRGLGKTRISALLGVDNKRTGNTRISTVNGMNMGIGNVRFSTVDGVTTKRVENLRLYNTMGVTIGARGTLRFSKLAGIYRNGLHNIRFTPNGCTKRMDNTRVNLLGLYNKGMGKVRVKVVGRDGSAATRGLNLIGVAPGAHVRVVLFTNGADGLGTTIHFGGHQDCAVLNVNARCLSLGSGFSNYIFCHTNLCCPVTSGLRLDNSLNCFRVRGFRGRSTRAPRHVCSLRTHVGLRCGFGSEVDFFTSNNCNVAHCCSGGGFCRGGPVFRTNIVLFWTTPSP